WGKPGGALAPRSAKQRNSAQKQAGGGSGPTPTPPPPPAPSPPRAPAITQAQRLAALANTVDATRKTHDPAAFVAQYSHLGDAAKSVAWGRAAMERGLDFPIEHVLDVASRVKAGPWSDLHSFVSGFVPQGSSVPNIRAL